ncbi:MAG: beta-ketoacyl synthase N-terminal-like domain-containing protein [Bacteroidota bacterium]
MKENTKKLTGFEIAIIGMAGVFPKSPTVKDYWKNLVAGNEMITFFTEEELVALGVDKSIYQNNKYVNAYGKIEGKEFFDAPFFKYLPAEASVMDPQTRLFHQVVWSALEDAGVQWDQQSNNIGLYAGAKENPLWKTYTGYLKKVNGVDYYTLNLLNSKDCMTTLVSYKLGLKGPSMSVNTTCSTSLVATHLACRALLMGECKVAVAGGASISSQPSAGYLHQEGMIFSSDGHCKTFDADSDGTVSGEGAAAVVLKRYTEAIKDGDHIYAIIKGSAINNDGMRKIGYTAPSIEGQTDCIKMAHTISKVAPESISYIEAHGTGTKLGDPIEIEALNKAFNNKQEKHCYIGSVKSSIGHLDAAAGVSGLIKTALALQHKTIPPSLNFEKENPQIQFDQGPFEVITEKKDWQRKGNEPLRAGVSSFGIGGTNAHVILEEIPTAPVAVTPAASQQIFPFSAVNPQSVMDYQKNLHTFLQENENIDLPNVAYTLQHGRKAFQFRDTIVAQSREDLLEQLAIRSKRKEPKTVKKEVNKLVFLFSGQGAQYHKMGADLYQDNAFFKAEMDKGFEQLKHLTGKDYTELIYAEKGDPSHIDNTLYTQPLLFIFEHALAKLMMEYGVQPDYLMGHSLGEYVAACISGVFTFEEALQIIVKRAELISSCPEGSMLSINCTEEEASAYLNDQLSLAVLNAPNQSVVSGPTEAIESLMKQLESEGRQHKFLTTSHAFHSAMMDGILDQFEQHVGQFNLQPPSIPFISNLTGEMIKAEEATSPAYWAKHLRQAVQFGKGLGELFKIKKLAFIEIGPGNRLIRLLKQNKPAEVGELRVASTVRNSAKEVNDKKHLLENLAVLWQNGCDINWRVIDANANRQKISLPTYVFLKHPYEAVVHLGGMGEDSSAPAATKPEGSKKYTKVAKAESEMENIKNIEAKDLSTLNEEEIQNEVIFLWKEFFGNDEIDVDSDFFVLGGDSLKAMSMINIIHEKFNAEVSITDFLEKSSVRDLSEELQNISWVNQDKNLSNKLTISV